MNITLSATAWQ